VALSPGTRLGAYEILSLIGSGGMGEVYRAKDTKLGRDVALKILPATFTNDPDRVARFRREAQVLASLNHPHIAQIHGLDEADSTQFLVLELVDGESLDKRIAAGPIPVDEALGIGRQIAEALEAAHERGIIHRDLKPANIAVSRDGNVKVLDFGLAKATEPATASGLDVTNSPTITTPAMMTGVGVILGTAAYMSPEQAKGRPADKRSDVWAFGCVLYEMLTGSRPFQADDVSDTLATILMSEPDWSACPARVPPATRALLEGCLKKDRMQRVGDISAALFVLRQPHVEPSPITGLGAPAAPWRRAASIVVAVVAAVALTLLIARYARPPFPVPRVMHFVATLPQGQRFTNGGRQLVAISPDGRQMVYVANQRLYLRSMSDPEARVIAGTDTGTPVLSPTFSPDGRSIAFWSGEDQTLKRIAVTGGAVTTICHVESPPFGTSWGADGVVFGERGTGIMRVSSDGGKPELLARVKSDEQAHGPQTLFDGQTLLFTLATGTAPDRWDKAQVVVQQLKSGERRTVLQGGSDARYLPSGHLVYAVGGVLFAVPFNRQRLEVSGAAIPIIEGIRRSDGGATGSAHVSVSNEGSVIYIPGPSYGAVGLDLALIDHNGGIEPLKLPPAAYEVPRISPDGKRIAVGTDDGREANVWIYELSGGSAIRRLTVRGRNRMPIWSADGDRVAFQSDREGDSSIFWQRADGTGTAERLTKADEGTSHIPESWFPNGKILLFSVLKAPTVTLWTFSLPDRSAQPFGDLQSETPLGAMASPDGRWVAYSVTTSGTSSVFAQPFPSTGAKYFIASGYHPVWSTDGKQLVFSQGGQASVVSVRTQPSFTFASANPMARGFRERGPTVEREYDTTPDAKRLIGVVPAGQVASALPATSEIHIVLNWFEELKSRVPTK